jgi:predicted TIM-barrel fold metal-dependent hydrolase
MTTTVTDSKAAKAAKRDAAIGLIDCDVHNAMPGRAALKEYLAKKWHRLYDQGVSTGVMASLTYPPARASVFRTDSVPVRDGAPGMPGSSLELMREQLLDLYDIRAGIVHPVIDVLMIPQHGELGTALANAMNEWMVADWLSQDERVFGGITVPIEDARAAVDVIERAAANPRFVKIVLPISTRDPMGHPRYRPIFEAAAAHGLPIAAHVGGFSGTMTSSGWSSFFVEQHTNWALPFQPQMVSLVASGVFKQLPDLKIVMEEGAIGWVPGLMWRMDRAWRSMAGDVPLGLDEPPSEIIRRHFWFTTQPLDEPERESQFTELLGQLDMTGHLMFASDYPHWDFDSPERVIPAVVGAEDRERIFSKNALELFDFGFPEQKGKKR